MLTIYPTLEPLKTGGVGLLQPFSVHIILKTQQFSESLEHHSFWYSL